MTPIIRLAIMSPGHPLKKVSLKKYMLWCEFKSKSCAALRAYDRAQAEKEWRV